MSDWQPIETAPTDGSKLLGWDGFVGDYVIMWWEADPHASPIGEPCWCEMADAPSKVDPIFWQPLPKAPA